MKILFTSNLFRALAVAILLLVALANLAYAQSGSSYNLSWWTVDGGGATFSTGGDYSLGSTIGQTDATQLHGGVYTLSGGFWAGGGAIPPEYHLYLPVVMR